MSKKLETILQGVPAATARGENYEKGFVINEPLRSNAEKAERIVAVVPFSVKQQIREYLATHPRETEKTVILKGLKSLGFLIPASSLEDARGKR